MEAGCYKVIVKNKNNINLMNQQRFRVHALIDENFGASDLYPKDIWFMTFQVEEGKFPKILKLDLKGHFYFGLNIDYSVTLYHDYETIFEKNSIAKNDLALKKKLKVGMYKVFIQNTSLKEGKEFKFSVNSPAYKKEETILWYNQEAFISPQFIIFSDLKEVDFEVNILQIKDPLAQYNLKILKEINSVPYVESIEDKRKFLLDFKSLIQEKNIDAIHEIIYHENFKDGKESLIPVVVLNEAFELIEKCNTVRTKIEKSLVKQSLTEINKVLLLTRDFEPKYCELLQNTIQKAEVCLVSLQRKEIYLDDMREIIESPFDLQNYEKLKNLRKEAYEQVGMYMFPKNQQERNILKFTEELLIKFEKKKEENKLLLSTLNSLIELDDLKTLESFLKSNKNDLPISKYEEAMSIIILNEEMNKKKQYEEFMSQKSENLIQLQIQQEKELEKTKEKEQRAKEQYKKEIEILEKKKNGDGKSVTENVPVKIEVENPQLNEYDLKKKTVLDELHKDLLNLDSEEELEPNTPFSSSPGGKFDLFVNPADEPIRKSSKAQKKELEELPTVEIDDLYETTKQDDESTQQSITDSTNEVHKYKIKIKQEETIPNICRDFHQSVLTILRYMELEKDPENFIVQNIDPYSEFIGTIFECLKKLMIDNRKEGIFKTKTSIFDIAKKYDSKVVSDFRNEKVFHSGKEQRSINEGYQLFIRFLMHSGRACNIFRSIIQDVKYSKTVYEDVSYLRNEEYRDQLLLTFDLMEHIRFSFLMFGSVPTTVKTPSKNDLTALASPIETSNSTSSTSATPLENSKSNQKLDEMVLDDADPILIKKKKKKKKNIQNLE